MEPKCNSETADTECISEGIPLTEKMPYTINDNSFSPMEDDGQRYAMTEKEENESISENEKEPLDLAITCNTYEIKLKKTNKFAINKSMLTLRITQALWYGAGSLPKIYLGIFLIQRGLSLVEMSSVFSTIFLFQFLACSITGVITDKIGNAKPVLMFLMLSVCSILVCMSLTPNINSVSCPLKYKEINESVHIEDDRNFTLCYMNCLFNNKNLDSNEDNASRTTTFKIGDDLTIDDSKTDCNFSDVLTNNSLDYFKNECCSACISIQTVNCSTSRNGNLVAVYSILILAFYSVWNTSYRFMNFTAASLATKNDSNFGKEYIFARCGTITTLIIMAFVLNEDNSSRSKINFDTAIWLTACIGCCACLALFFTTVPILPPGRNLLKKAFNMMRDVDILAFILLVFMAGNGYAFHSTFHLVFLESIDVPRIVVGMHSVAMVLYGLPLLLTSEWWLEKFGANKLFILAIFLDVAYFTACSFLQNSWWILILDVCLAFSNDLFWVIVVVHCWNIAPEGFGATLNAVTGSVHFGIGRSSGVFFGGMMINYMGLRNAYRIMASILFATAILYSIFVYHRHTSTASNITRKGNKDIEKEISKSPDAEEV